VVNLRSVGVGKFSKAVDLSKDLNQHLFNEERYIDYVTPSNDDNHPIFTKFQTHPVWSNDPKCEPFQTIGQYSYRYTCPAAPDPKAQIVIYNHVIANMYAKVVTGTPTKDASA